MGGLSNLLVSNYNLHSFNYFEWAIYTNLNGVLSRYILFMSNHV